VPLPHLKTSAIVRVLSASADKDEVVGIATKVNGRQYLHGHAILRKISELSPAEHELVRRFISSRLAGRGRRGGE